MKILKKISTILIIVAIINVIIAPRILATTDFSTVVDEANDWLETGANNATISPNSIIKVLKPIAQALTTIGVGILLCVTAYMGIKWVTAKPDEQAKLKQQTVGLLVSAIVIMGAYTIWSIALGIVSKL